MIKHIAETQSNVKRQCKNAIETAMQTMQILNGKMQCKNATETSMQTMQFQMVKRNAKTQLKPQ